MKVIFLDIDGVLNCQSSKSHCGIFVGIDDSKVKRLRKIVDATGSEIVLSSSWRHHWWKGVCNHKDGKYINNKLRREQLRILDKTGEDPFNRRPNEIYDWLKDKTIESFVILDDEDFCWGYFRDNWVQTEFYNDNGGLQDEHVEKAIAILNASSKEHTMTKCKVE